MLLRQFDVKLLSDLSLTADAATVGKHTCLDYIPGSAFLGAAVAEDLRRGNEFDADFFLSGRVRFTDALPVVNGRSTYPMPRSFGRVKNKNWNGEKAYNPIASDRPSDVQLQPWKSGYMTDDGVVYSVDVKSNIKTAIDRNVGRAKDEELFETESISSGQCFRMRIMAESEDDLKKASELISGIVYIGRSRTAEFGKVQICETASDECAYEQSASGDTRLVHIFLVSDLLLKHNGMPSLVPDASDFGIENASVVWDKTFIDTKTVSPWNSFFNCRTEERQLIAKGSVITFRTEDEMTAEDLAALRSKLSGGVGFCREEGLGDVMVNPKWLINAPILKKYERKTEKRLCQAMTPLSNYLSRKFDAVRYAAQAHDEAQAWVDEWIKTFYSTKEDAPSKAQWGTIRVMAIWYKEDELKRELRLFCTKAGRRRQWEIKGKGCNGKTMYEAMIEKLEGAAEKYNRNFASIALHHAAVAMAKRIEKENGDR